MTSSSLSKAQIGLAGEFRVASELLRRGHCASITFGNRKATDILITQENNRYLKVEVKTSKNGRNFVTGYYPKYTNADQAAPDIWVLYLPRKIGSTDNDRFFIFTHARLAELQLIMNNGVKTEKGKGVDNVTVREIEERCPDSEDAWAIIAEA